MKALIIRVLVTLGVLTLLAPGTVLAEKSYSADRFDVNIAVEPGGTLLVTESVVFRFTGGPFTFVYRDLPTAYTDGITDIQATLDSVPLPLGTSPGQLEITETNPIHVRWHFASTSDSTHTFGLTYRALGVVRQESAADALDWQALPATYDYSIAASIVTVTWDSTRTGLLGTPQVTRGRANVESGKGQVTFAARDLAPKTPLQIALQYPRGSLIAAPPQWQIRAAQDQARAEQTAARQAQLAPVFILIAGLFFAAGAFVLFSYWNGYRRQIDSTISDAFYPTRPPDDLPPAIAGAINGNGPAWSNALAALFDLAQRGVIRIDEIPGRGWFRSRDFGISLLSEPADLRSHERALIALLFESKKGKRSTVQMSQVTQNLTSQWNKFSNALKQEMQEMRLIDPVRAQARRRLRIVSAILVSLGGFGFLGSLLLIPALGGWVVLIALSVVAVAVVSFVLASELSSLSEQGARRAARWQDFYRYLRSIVQGKQAGIKTDLFEHYLPFAASYGLSEKWAKYFQKHDGAQTPAWFHALSTSHAGDDGGMGAFVVMVNTTSAAGGGDGGAAGAGAGAAGGGASGAG